MNILLVNDDGYKWEGINLLREVLKQYGNVYMVAPLDIQSGKGCAITSFLGIDATIIDDMTIAVHGTPVDCVEYAICYYKDVKFDLVVSGCNEGYNLSSDIMYSGTCGACFQALMCGLKAIAFSTYSAKSFYQVTNQTIDILDYIFKNKLLSTKYFLNINYQHPDYEKPKGIKITKPFFSTYNYYFVNKDNKTYIGRDRNNLPKNLNQDIIAVNNGYISISPISMANVNEKHYKDLKKLVK